MTKDEIRELKHVHDGLISALQHLADMDIQETSSQGRKKWLTQVDLAEARIRIEWVLDRHNVQYNTLQ